MFAIERQQKILQYVNEKQKASVIELSGMFEVTNITIRRDLEELARNGLVIKIHGGALAVTNTLTREIPYYEKTRMQAKEKKMIGLYAANMISEGDVVVFDSGSTTLEVARNMNTTGIVAITNDLKIAMELAQKPKIKLVVTGGILQEGLFTLMGLNSEDFLSKIHVNKTFLGADAISLKHGVTNRSLEEVQVKRLMVKAGDEVILVADHTKFDKDVFVTVCQVNEIDKVITDSMDEQLKCKLEEFGIKIFVV